MRILLMALITLVCGYSSVQTVFADEYTPAGAPLSANKGNFEIAFSEDEIRIIRSYFETNRTGTVRKGKKKGLPPGIAKNLQRGKPLPPGIAKRALPYDLQQELPELPTGYERVIVASKILLIELGTQIVRDILIDATVR
jgi:hypothetical protein